MLSQPAHEKAFGLSPMPGSRLLWLLKNFHSPLMRDQISRGERTANAPRYIRQPSAGKECGGPQERAALARHQHALRRLPTRRRSQGFVGLIECEAMRDHFREGKLPLRGAQEFERGLEMTRLARPGANDLKLLARDDVRVPGDRTSVTVVTSGCRTRTG